MTTTTELQIQRMQLPPVQIPAGDALWGQHDTYAQVSCGGITAEVLRFSYWDERDGRPDIEQSFEVRTTPAGCQTAVGFASCTQRIPTTSGTWPCAGKQR